MTDGMPASLRASSSLSAKCTVCVVVTLQSRASGASLLLLSLLAGSSGRPLVNAPAATSTLRAVMLAPLASST